MPLWAKLLSGFGKKAGGMVLSGALSYVGFEAAKRVVSNAPRAVEGLSGPRIPGLGIRFQPWRLDDPFGLEAERLERQESQEDARAAKDAKAAAKAAKEAGKSEAGQAARIKSLQESAAFQSKLNTSERKWSKALDAAKTDAQKSKAQLQLQRITAARQADSLRSELKAAKEKLADKGEGSTSLERALELLNKLRSQTLVGTDVPSFEPSRLLSTVETIADAARQSDSAEELELLAVSEGGELSGGEGFEDIDIKPSFGLAGVWGEEEEEEGGD